MRTRLFILASMLAAGATSSLAEPAAAPAIPARLTSYRAWKPLTTAPRPVPLQLAQLCAPALQGAPPPASASLNATYGPHANRWIVVFANPAAASALADPTVRQFPAGAMIAKEKRRTAGADHPDGVGFMIKHKAGEFAASDGWEFGYFPAPDNAVDYSACVACHKARGNKDYVFGRYPPQN